MPSELSSSRSILIPARQRRRLKPKAPRAGAGRLPSTFPRPRRSSRPALAATLVLLAAVPAAGPVSSARGDGTRGGAVAAREPAKRVARRNGSGVVRAPQPVAVGSGTGRFTDVFVRPGQRVKRGQLLARSESASLRRRVRSAESSLKSAQTRLEREKRRAAERNRRLRESAARALAARNAKDALEGAQRQADAEKTGLEQRVARARRDLADAQQSARARDQRLRSDSERAHTSLERARTAAKANRARLDSRVARAEANVEQAQAAARAANERAQATVGEAQQGVDAAKAGQAEHAQSYEAAVEQAQKAVTAAEGALASDQDRLSTARARREELEDKVAGRRAEVDELRAKVDSDEAAVEECKADPPAEGCSALEQRHEKSVAKLKDEKSRQAEAESTLAEAKADVSSLETTVADDQSALDSAQGSLADARQAQSTGQAEDEQRVQAAQDTVASAQASAASAAAENDAKVSDAKHSADSASSARRAGVARDRDSVARARSSLAGSQGRLAAGRSEDERAVGSARQGVNAAQASLDAAAARTGRRVGAASSSLGAAQQSLNSSLASNRSFLSAPTPSELAVAETRVELAMLSLTSAREQLAEGSELRAPASGTVVALTPQELALGGLDTPQVEITFSARDAARIKPGQAATVTLGASPEVKRPAHVISVGPVTTGADGSSRRKVTFALDRADPNVTPGMTAQAEVEPEADATGARLGRLRRRLAAERASARETDSGVVGIATRYLGVPYVWGGASPQTGFDCSGLVMYVYAQRGISLPHYAASQFNYGLPVARDQLEPGDLVFFDGLGHVGIYVGNDEFIHAPHTGDVVKISSLNEFSYASTYVGARRLETSNRLGAGSNPQSAPAWSPSEED